MSPVSPVFLNEGTVIIGLKNGVLFTFTIDSVTCKVNFLTFSFNKSKLTK